MKHAEAANPIQHLAAKVEALKQELKEFGLTDELIDKAGDWILLRKAATDTSSQDALHQLLAAMEIDPKNERKLKDKYRVSWDKESRDHRSEEYFERFSHWFNQYDTDEKERPRDISASHLTWKGYYFHMRS